MHESHRVMYIQGNSVAVCERCNCGGNYLNHPCLSDMENPYHIQFLEMFVDESNLTNGWYMCDRYTSPNPYNIWQSYDFLANKTEDEIDDMTDPMKEMFKLNKSSMFEDVKHIDGSLYMIRAFKC